jgi:hypothetical protein
MNVVHKPEKERVMDRRNAGCETRSVAGRTGSTRRRALIALMLGALSVVVAPGVLPATPALAKEDAVSYARLAREGYALSKSDADALEAQLASDPDNLAVRTRLLGFYFRHARELGPGVAVEARRRHILWLIEHHPESEALALSEATIDREGHFMADQAGYEQASALWIEQARRHDKNAAVLGNAAKFFQLSDKARAIALLRQAQQADPGNPEWPTRVGYVSALAILGVDMMNQNGLPTRHNAAEAKSDLAVRVADELKTSTDVVVVGVAGRILAQYGLMMSAMYREKFAVDYAALAEALLVRAQELEPGNPTWSRELEEFRKQRAGIDRPK